MAFSPDGNILAESSGQGTVKLWDAAPPQERGAFRGAGRVVAFTTDGKHLIYGHEPGGGSAARCQATSTIVERTLYFIDPVTGKTTGEMLHPRPQGSRENCTWHNFNVVPTKAGYAPICFHAARCVSEAADIGSRASSLPAAGAESRTIYVGLPLVSRKMRRMYSPMIPRLMS